MTTRQFGFLIGFLVAWLWAQEGFLSALAAVVAGVIALAVAHVADSDADLGELVERVTGNSRR